MKMKTLPVHAHPVERDIAHGLVNRVLADGNTISVFDGEEYSIKRSSDAVAILSAMSHTGEDTLVIRSPIGGSVPRALSGAKIGSVFLVYGNEPENLIADFTNEDYTCALCDALSPFHAVKASCLDVAYPGE
jgi:hypothetical protein